MFKEAYPDTPVVWLDAGNFAAVGLPSDDFRNAGIVEGLNIMGYAAVMLGERELADGYESFLEISKPAKFPFVSANFVFEKDREPVVAPYVIHKATAGDREIRIAILGLNRFNTAFLKTTADGRNIVVSSPFEAARKVVPEARKSADLVVVLTSLSISQARQLAGQVKGIDVIIGSSGAVLSRIEDESVGVPIVYTGNEGKYLAEVRVFLPDGGAEGPPRVQRVNHYLNKDYPQDPELQMLIQDVLAKENDINRKLATAQVEREPVPEGVATYAGWKACASCHADIVESWQKTRHATAFDTLVKKNQDFNRECVGCHTVGFGRRDGFVNAKATPELIHVQCESCHGPASLHVSDPTLRYGSAGARSCLGCHDPENSPEFDFFTFWPRIQH